MATPGDPDYKRGKLAYEAYCEAIKPLSAMQGPWDGMADNFRTAWIAAALAVAEDVAGRPPSDGMIPRPTVGDSQ